MSGLKKDGTRKEIRADDGRPFGKFRVVKNRGGGFLTYQVGWAESCSPESRSHGFGGKFVFWHQGRSSSHLVSHRPGG